MPISFTKVKLENGWLGNMAPFPVVYEGKEWRTTEALFQALRFNDEAVREAIRLEKSPMGAKMQAKKNSELMVIEPTSEADLKNMELVLRLKLQSHPNLKEQLLAGGDEVIIEDVSSRNSQGRHTFWGMAFRNGEWQGDNMLGKIWMKIRDELREENGKSLSGL